MNDAELLEDLKAKKPGSEEAIYARYSKAMLRFCLRFFYTEQDAEYAMNWGFHGFFEKMAGPAPPPFLSLRNYLYGQMRFRCLKILEKIPMDLPITEDVENGIADREEIHAGLACEDILGELERLSEGDRMIIQLFVFEERTHTEIAAMLHITESASKVRLHVARKRLKKRLTDKTKDYVTGK